MFCLRVSSGLMPILESPESSSWIWKEVETCCVAVMNRCATARISQQPALYSKPARPSISFRSCRLQFQRPTTDRDAVTGHCVEKSTCFTWSRVYR